MKRLNFIIISMMSVMLIGCQDRLVVSDSSQSGVASTKAGEHTVQADKAYVFFRSEKDFADWTNIVGLDKRFAACEVPEDVLLSMTTEALIQAALGYPLNYILFAYDNPLDAIETMIKNSSLHQELLKRADAEELLLDHYENSLPSFGKQSGDMIPQYIAIPLEAEYFLGYLIYSEYIESLKKGERSSERIASLAEKRRIIEKNPGQFGILALEPLQMIESSLSQRTGGIFLENTTIFTPFLQSLTGQLFSELSSVEIQYLDNLACTNHPNATLISHASACYNSHSYAWHSSSSSNQVWLTPFYPSNYYTPYYYQLKKYWTNDLYESCDSLSATKVYNSIQTSSSSMAHSSLVGSNGRNRSKWAKMPLMEHDPHDFPDYVSTSNESYYREKTLPLLNDAISITGPSYVSPNQTNIYSISVPSNNNVCYYISAESLDPNWSFTFTQTSTTSYTLNCQDYGAYNIVVHGYAGLNNCYDYSHKSLLVICVGNLTRQCIENDGIEDVEDFIMKNRSSLAE